MTRPGPSRALRRLAFAALAAAALAGCRLLPWAGRGGRAAGPEAAQDGGAGVTSVAGPEHGAVVHLALGLPAGPGDAVAEVAARAWARAGVAPLFPAGARPQVEVTAGRALLSISLPSDAAAGAAEAWSRALARPSLGADLLAAARAEAWGRQALDCAEAARLARSLSERWRADRPRPEPWTDPFAVEDAAVRAWVAGRVTSGAVVGAAGPDARRRAGGLAEAITAAFPRRAPPGAARPEDAAGGDAEVPPASAPAGPLAAAAAVAGVLGGEAVFAEAAGGAWLRLSRPLSPRPSPEEAAALLVAAFVLAPPGAPAGLLDRGLRAERGIVGGAAAHPVHLEGAAAWPRGAPHPPRFEIAVGPLATEHAGFALRWIGGTLARLRAGEVEPEGVAQARAAARARLRLLAADPEGALARAVLGRLSPGALPDLEAVTRALDAIDPAAVRRAAETWLVPGGWRLVFSGPMLPDDLRGAGAPPAYPVSRPRRVASEDAVHAALRLDFRIAKVEPCSTTPQRVAAGAHGEHAHGGGEFHDGT